MLLKQGFFYVIFITLNDYVYFFLILFICVLIYIYTYKCFIKNEYNFALLGLMISGVLLRVYTSSDFFLHDWDEKYHALVAKNLLLHPLKPTLYDNPILHYDYRNWIANHIWLHKQPIPLWTITISIKFFGVNELAVRIPSIILSTISIPLIFNIGRYLYNSQVGILSAFFLSINGLIIELSAGRVATDHIDIFFLFFIEVSIFCTILFSKSKKNIYNIFSWSFNWICNSF